MEGLTVTVGGYNDKIHVLLRTVLDKLRGLQVHPDRLRVLKEKVTNLVLAALNFSPSMPSVLTPRRLGPRTDPARIRELLHGATVGPLGVLCDVGVHADHLDACGEAARAVAYARSSLSRSMPTLISRASGSHHGERRVQPSR